MNPIWESIRLSVCRQCIDGDSSGACRLPAGELCTLEVFFPSVLSTIASVPTWSVEKQIEAMRSTVCSQCPEQGQDGACQKRKALECALDRYYPLVLEKVHSMKTFVE
ncbi:MAG: hypothetical protein HYW57_09225 [Ignavibacteriales bacterium]|nr:hypothetical protein [Ignavibacteriales bacterium]